MIVFNSLQRVSKDVELRCIFNILTLNYNSDCVNVSDEVLRLVSHVCSYVGWTNIYAHCTYFASDLTAFVACVQCFVSWTSSVAVTCLVNGCFCNLSRWSS